ncbi:hypothetical protein CCZ27_10430 [Thauera sinica]|nr:hypothetical protein CCZ27_10430 [Thauera sp. K11]
MRSGDCHLPLYIFCGEHLLCAKLRRASIDASAGAREEIERIVTVLRARWPEVAIVLRADSGFARDELMTWCEKNAVDYVFGLARNARLRRAIGRQLREAKQASQRSHRPARRFRDLTYRTRHSWSRRRRVVAKAEHTGDKANPRFVVTSLSKAQWPVRERYDDVGSTGRSEWHVRSARKAGDGRVLPAIWLARAAAVNAVRAFNTQWPTAPYGSGMSGRQGRRSPTLSPAGSRPGELAVDDEVPQINDRRVVASPALSFPCWGRATHGCTSLPGSAEICRHRVKSVHRPETRIDAGLRNQDLPSTRKST